MATPAGTQRYGFHQLTLSTTDLPYAKERLTRFFAMLRMEGVQVLEASRMLSVELNGEQVNSLFESAQPGAKFTLTMLTRGDTMKITVTPIEINTPAGTEPSALGVRLTTFYATPKEITKEADPAAFALRATAYKLAIYLLRDREAEAKKEESETAVEKSAQQPTQPPAAPSNGQQSAWEQGGAQRIAPGVYMTGGKNGSATPP